MELIESVNVLRRILLFLSGISAVILGVVVVTERINDFNIKILYTMGTLTMVCGAYMFVYPLLENYK